MTNPDDPIERAKRAAAKARAASVSIAPSEETKRRHRAEHDALRAAEARGPSLLDRAVFSAALELNVPYEQLRATAAIRKSSPEAFPLLLKAVIEGARAKADAEADASLLRAVMPLAAKEHHRAQKAKADGKRSAEKNAPNKATEAENRRRVQRAAAVEGASKKGVARDLGMSPQTVRKHWPKKK